MNDKQRAEFEKWAKSKRLNTTRFGDGYDYDETDCMWNGWKARSASIVIYLPRPTWNDEYNMGDVKQAIENAGVRYE